ncbi:SH3 domain-containing protein [Streptomyces sp. NBC_01716]|uniref:SH3 domain-containing protein n=1 Tax=Streptomyces sp. NBC_01716 TaxID=2975917 RepID=UPI002E301831|nr:SH3 domain-containing protein [Streptomyces sp. NBC_01716]
MSQRSLRFSRARRSARPQRVRGSFGPYAATLAVAVAALTATPAIAAVPAPPPVSSGGHTAVDRPAAVDPETAEAAEAARTEEAQTAEQAMASHAHKGRVTARTGLLLRDKPTRSSRVVGSLPYGSIVHIFCKVRGDNVNGNNRWYLLADGTWAWASAAYIDNIGKAPRWC